MVKVTFNGKFLSSRPTGVDRVASQLIRAIDRLAAARDPATAGLELEMVVPRDARRRLALGRTAVRTGGVFTWQPWEQFDLPRLVRGGLLVSLCNLAPLVHRHGVVMIHDAQVYLTPSSYPRAFVAWYRFVLPRIGRRLAAVVTVSDYSRRQLARLGVAPLDRISVIHNGADHMAEVVGDPSIVARLGLEDRRYAVALANVQAHKNIAVLIRAMRAPQMAGYRLVLVGADDARDFARARTPVHDRVVFAGRLSDAEFAGLLGSAACLACPSTTEGFGLPPLEAMMVGCPAVVAPCGALPEVCGDAAGYAAPDDPAAWARAIAELATDPVLRASRIAAGRERAAAFTWDRSARMLLDVIRRVA